MDGKQLRGIDPQERDFALLRTLYESRVMTTGHATSLFFKGSLDAARKRLQRLKQAGLVRDRAREAGEPAVLQLAAKGFESLKYHDQLHGYPTISDTEFTLRSRVSPLTLRHELAVMDVKVALSLALAKQPRVSNLRFLTWPRLCEFITRQPIPNGYGSREVVVKPDGFLSFRQEKANDIDEHFYFIEVDMGTASNRVLVERMLCYREHFRGGGFALSRGGSREDREQFPFRVLVIVKTFERMMNLADRLLHQNPPIKTMAWLTTLTEILRDPLGSIWTRPSEFGNTLKSRSTVLPRTHRPGDFRPHRDRNAALDSNTVTYSLIQPPAKLHATAHAGILSTDLTI